MMKVKDYKELWRSEKGNVFVFYNQFDMGMKYKVYCKSSYDRNIRAKYLISFETISEALNYAKQVHDDGRTRNY